MSEFSEYMRLLPYGYAPGNYMSKCFACEKVVADVDKRATSCRPCAESAFKDHEIERLRAEVAGLRECAIDLWMMLDDIDTGGDRAKADDVLYRAIAERTHRRRFSPKYQIVIDAIDAARKGTTPTTPPPSPSPRS